VQIELRNTSARALDGLVVDDPVDDATIDGLPARFRLAPYATVTLSYEITPTRRGVRSLDGITARYAAPLGLVAKQERSALPASFDVYPDVHAARSLDLLRRQGRQDVRLGSLRVRGGDTEFERLRPYARGDEIRQISWRATARREELTVRQLQTESNQNVVFVLDLGRGMRAEAGGLGLVDHALNASLLLADVALKNGDRAGLFAFDDAPRSFVPPTAGRAGARKLTRAAYALEATLAATDYRAGVSFLQSQVKARSLFVFFTNPLEPRSAADLASALRTLLPRHLPVCVLMRDAALEALALSPSGSASELYARAAAAEALTARTAMIRELGRRGVLVLDATPEEITPGVIQRYLEIKARGLL
jgi:uncharacterized protein (DUF58 family)